jgi:hypothetical protein
MDNKYNGQDIAGLLRDINAVQDLIQVLHTCAESTVPGIAVALEKLIDPVALFLERANAGT